jgi:hypothetical protein
MFNGCSMDAISINSPRSGQEQREQVTGFVGRAARLRGDVEPGRPGRRDP